MRKKMLVLLVLSVVVVLTLAGCGKKSSDYTIAINQYVEHPSLDGTRDGFLAALKDAGIVEGENLKVDFNTAQADQGNAQSIAQKIASQKYDLVLAIATPSAMATAKEVSNMPVLFAAVTDPVYADLVTDLKNPGGNVSGAADSNPEATVQLMDFIAEHLPDVKNVGIVINKGELNAVVTADHAREALAAHGINLIEAGVATTADVKMAAEALVGQVDAIFIALDNEVVDGLGALLEVVNSNQIPFFSSDRDSVEAGAFATVGFRYYDHGYQVGEMAVEILKNGKNPGEMEVTIPDKLDFIINLSAAKEQGITVTDAMKAHVQDQANNIIE